MVFIPVLIVVLCSNVATSPSPIEGDEASTDDHNTTTAPSNALVSRWLYDNIAIVGS